MISPIVTTYFIYLVISIALTVWVARTLHHNGRVFLVDVFAGNEALAAHRSRAASLARRGLMPLAERFVARVSRYRRIPDTGGNR